jgi:hypothetical protein
MTIEWGRTENRLRLNGPDATGQRGPEGWTVYTEPGPRFQGSRTKP